MEIDAAEMQARIAALRDGDLETATQFVKEIALTVWGACALLTADEAQTREAFVEIMALLKANNFARFDAYTGRGPLETFVALNVRDLLATRMLRLLHEDRQKGWRAFEGLFKADLVRLIHRRMRGAAHEDSRREAYQQISLAMVEEDYRRLSAYGGNGSFAGFVLRTADRLLIDFLRASQSRRRPYALRLAASEAELREIPDALETSPERQLVQAEEDAQLAGALDVLMRAMDSLPDAERLYLQIVLSLARPPRSREIAQLMHRPVEDIYKLKQRVLKHLRDLIAEESAVKTWRASV
jgi:DNA-directed RNA polymerase specialized sigma24 family protein